MHSIARSVLALALFVLLGLFGIRTSGAAQVVLSDPLTAWPLNFGIQGDNIKLKDGAVHIIEPTKCILKSLGQSVGDRRIGVLATGNNVLISRSVTTENGIAGIEADPGAQVFVDNTEISHNVSYGSVGCAVGEGAVT